MKNAGLIFIGMALSLSCLNSSSRTAAQEPPKGSTATLYSVLERGDNRTVSWKLIPEPLNQSGKSASR